MTDDFDAADDLDPMDFYEPYSEWLMKNEMVFNGDHLVNLLEDAHRFDEFLEQHRAKA